MNQEINEFLVLLSNLLNYAGTKQEAKFFLNPASCETLQPQEATLCPHWDKLDQTRPRLVKKPSGEDRAESDHIGLQPDDDSPASQPHLQS
jgi:hypothetical protein